ncbi:MAG: aminodeoxychorismate lyase, partial [Sulfurimonadaceae bacterium]|nr:aminodeoxychorismate lyase [Sulfurimonadaceae bacterium]
MNNAKLTIARWTAEIVLIIVLSFIYYLTLPVTTSKVLYIPHGSIKKIITYLDYKNIDVSALDGYLVRFIGMPQQGWIDMGENRLSRADFLYRLTTAKAAMKDVTLIPGETTYVFLHQLAATMGLDRKLLQHYY